MVTVGGRSDWRRTRLAAAVVFGAVTLAGTTSLLTSAAGATTDPGQGTALAFTDRIDPRAGSLSIGVTFGRAVAGHQNEQAKAQSQAIDLGAIGTSLASYVCGQAPTLPQSQQPQPLLVETGQANAAQGISQSDAGGGYTKFGKATTAPYGEAITTTAPLSIAGVASVGGGVAKSWSGLVNGQREAGATVDIGSLTLPGAISLSGLHWEVVFRSSGDGHQAGTFSIGHATIAGAAVPTTDVTKLLGQLNAVLGPLGLQLFPPAARTASGNVYVDALQISIVPNATRDTLFAAVLSGILPIRQPLFDALHKAFCQTEVPINIADIAIGSISGAGSFNLSLGGVQAGSATLAANQFNLGLPGFNPGAATPETTPSLLSGSGSAPGNFGATPSLGVPSSASGGGSTPPAATGSSGGANQLAAPALAVAAHGTRGGALALVGLSGLALLAALAEGDRRKMRRAQRKLSMFEE
jgi:hypothetical protein